MTVCGPLRVRMRSSARHTNRNPSTVGVFDEVGAEYTTAAGKQASDGGAQLVEFVLVGAECDGQVRLGRRAVPSLVGQRGGETRAELCCGWFQLCNGDPDESVLTRDHAGHLCFWWDSCHHAVDVVLGGVGCRAGVEQRDVRWKLAHETWSDSPGRGEEVFRVRQQRDYRCLSTLGDGVISF